MRLPVDDACYDEAMTRACNFGELVPVIELMCERIRHLPSDSALVEFRALEQHRLDPMRTEFGASDEEYAEATRKITELRYDIQQDLQD